MQYFYDFEFNENGETIKPISMGMVSQDGRELYIIFDFDVLKVWRNKWLRENVLYNIYKEQLPGFKQQHDFNYFSMRYLIKSIGISKQKAAQKIVEFVNPEKYGKPEFWAYYANYDHVALCQLFGRMIDLPEGFPYYTMDLKQWCKMIGDPELPKQENGEHNALEDARWNQKIFEWLYEYNQAERGYIS